MDIKGCKGESIVALDNTPELPLNAVEIARERRNYRKHTAKNLAWILPELVNSGARTLEELKQIFDPNSNHGEIMDDLKQLSAYTDIFNSGKWSSPENVIDKDLAIKIFTIAKLMVKKEGVMTSERELELWVKYLKPARSQGKSAMKEALKKYYADAASQGIIAFKDLPVLTQFLI